jgi:uncharacterized glyoxalase superfamily protein PhnB
MSETQTTQSHQTVTPYLIVPHALDFIAFLKKVFDARTTYMMMRDESTVAHAEMQIGTSVIMLSDSMEGYPPRGAGLFVYVPDCDETYNKALAAGAKSISEPADMPYGRSCGISDPFGCDWWPTVKP